MNDKFAALADARRIEILDTLLGGPRSVGEIAAVLGMDQAALSKHLRILKDAELLSVEKHGRRRIYAMNGTVFAQLAQQLTVYTGAASSLPPEDFEDAERYPMLRLLLNARLMRLLYLVRNAGGRELPELEGCSILGRDILSLLGNSGELSWSELVALTGEEKGQVSRAVKALSEMEFVSRENLRAKIALTDRGEAVFKRFMALARLGEEYICAGLSGDARAELCAMSHALSGRAILLLSDEQARSGARGENLEYNRGPHEAESLPEIGGELAGFIMPSLLRLAAYLRRSATVAYKREAGLSNLSWLVLSQVGEHEELTVTELAGLISRDKGQISRIIGEHKAAGLIKRHRSGRTGTVCLVLTALGKDLYNRMCVRAVQRNEFLFQHISAEKRQSYLFSLDALIKNAEAETDGLAHLHL